REMGRKSILDFAQLYFSEYMTSKPAAFHEEICKVLIEMSDQRKRNLAVAAPRGHAKSTLVSLFYVVWSICYGKESYIVLFSSSSGQAISLMADIKTAFETNDKLIRDFPEVSHIGDGSVRQQWTQQAIVTQNDIKVQALGCEQNMRGFRSGRNRPTLVILDDVDGDRNTYTAETRDKVLKWFKGTVRYMGSPKRTNMIAVGTLLHTESLLAKFINQNEFQNWETKLLYKAVIENAKREDLWEQWRKIVFFQEKYKGKASKYLFDDAGLDYDALIPFINKRNYIDERGHVVEWFSGLDDVFKGMCPELSEDQFQKLENILMFIKNNEEGMLAADCFFYDHKKDMLLGSKVLWEAEHDYYSLMKIKKIEGSHEFNREMQNDPKSAEECFFNPEKFEYWTKKYENEVELVNTFKDDLEYFGACDPSMGKKTRNADYSAIIILARHRKVNVFYVLRAEIKQRTPDELIQDIVNCHRGRTFSGFVFEANLFQGLFIPSIRTYSAQEGVHTSILPIHNTTNKERRIRQLANFITPGWLRFSKDHEKLLEQFQDFPMGSHDDGPDALEMALRCANSTKPGTLWAGLNSNDGSPQVLSPFCRDPNAREYGSNYDITDDSTPRDKLNKWYYGKDDDD
ncbi:MAG: phage terminase large subunit, partial [Candidatus Paceibacterota bacterium]